MPVNSNLHNLRAVLIGTTSRFMFSLDAESRAQAQAFGAEDFGNLKAHQLQGENTTENILTSLDGVTQIVDEQSRQVALGYLLTSREQAVREQLMAYFATETTPFTQAAIAAQNGNALAFDVVASKLNRWYELQYNGVAVRNVTSVTIADLVEGTDFVVHKELGLIRFLTAQAASRVPVITAPEITAASDGYMRKFLPLKRTIFRGYASLMCFDRDPKNKVVFDHRWFRCTLKIEGQPDRSSEGGAGEIQIKAMIMDDAGEVFARD